MKFEIIRENNKTQKVISKTQTLCTCCYSIDVVAYNSVKCSIESTNYPRKSFAVSGVIK